ncbi:hypothetical protein [uncultured Desulfobacter sp.]|uniref:hypothetical protein n=1 Tax=uncultured Desulfobacter sp. TaxID=240139 RepID=UPI002AA87786|nr:hypothetical protein [uncultured Desulfobacter sp.]
MSSIEKRIAALEKVQANLLQPGQLPEKHFIACFDRKFDDQGQELPVISLGGIERLLGEDDEDFKNRAVREYAKGMPRDRPVFLIAKRQEPMEESHVTP